MQSTNETISHPLGVGEPAPTFEAQPVFGLPVAVPTPSQPLVLLFIRHLGDPFARQTIVEAQARYADFDRRGIKLAAVTQTDLTFARDFVPRNHVLFPIVTDPEGHLQRLYGIDRDPYLLDSLKAALTGCKSRLVAALQMGHGKKAGPFRQLPAEFVIDTNGSLVYAHYGQSITDGPNIDQLLEAASD